MDNPARDLAFRESIKEGHLWEYESFCAGWDAARSYEMFSWLASVRCSSLTLGRDDDHACNYMTAADWIDERREDFEGCSPEDIEAMKATNTIWKLQIYPNTPVGFVWFFGPTMESVIRQAMQALARR